MINKLSVLSFNLLTVSHICSLTHLTYQLTVFPKKNSPLDTKIWIIVIPSSIYGSKRKKWIHILESELNELNQMSDLLYITQLSPHSHNHNEL